jgi:hypothetical protein
MALADSFDISAEGTFHLYYPVIILQKRSVQIGHQCFRLSVSSPKPRDQDQKVAIAVTSFKNPGLEHCQTGNPFQRARSCE